MYDADFYDRPIYAPDQLSCLDFGGPFYGPPVRSFETYPPRQVSKYKDEPVDVDEFKAIFYEFADDDKWPRREVEAAVKRARFYVPLWSQCDYLDGKDRDYARGLLSAHIMVMSRQLRAEMEQPGLGGQNGGGGGVVGGSMTTLGGTGIVTSATIGSVSYNKTLPQSASAYEFWLNQTKYGIEFQAFLSNHTPVGIMAQGDDIRECFRD